MFVIAADQTEGQFITVQGEVDDALETTLVIIAKLCLQTAFEFFGGRIGDYIDCAAGGIVAKQGELRSPPNLGALHIQQIEISCDGQGNVHAIYIGSSRRDRKRVCEGKKESEGVGHGG